MNFLVLQEKNKYVF